MNLEALESIESVFERAGLVHSANRGGLVISGHPGEASKALLLEGRIKPGKPLTPQVMKTSE